MPANRTLGRVLRRLRQERGWSQVHLAERLGIAQSVLSAKERGKISVLPFEYAKLARALEISVEELEARFVQGATIPVLGLVSSVGKAEVGTIDLGDVEAERAFAMVIDDGSMEPRIHAGDYVVFAPADAATRESLDGSVVLAEFRNSRRTVARYFTLANGTVALTKDNPAFAPTVHRLDEFASIAIAVERRSQAGL